jgi:hypothetical protein
MSATVFNPVALKEIYRIRSPGISRRNQHNTVTLAKVKRDLFGRCDSDDVKK